MAGTLTVNLALQKSRVDNPLYVKKLNVCGVQLDDIGVIEQFPNLEVCSFSVNKITDLDSFRHCPRLSEVYLRKNLISDLRQVAYLGHLPSLHMLGLSENPISELPEYRAFVIAACSKLQRLDDQDVTSFERETAETKFPDAANAVPARSSMSPRRSSKSLPMSNDDVRHPGPAAAAAAVRRSVNQEEAAAPAARGGQRLARSPPQVAASAQPTRQQHHQHPHVAAHAHASAPAPHHTIREETAIRAIFALLSDLSPDGLSTVQHHLQTLHHRR